MEKGKMKSYLWLIAFSIGLVLLVINFRTIIHGIGVFIKLLMPLFLGIAIAFVLNRPYEWFNRLYKNKCKIKPKAAKPLAIVTVYVLTFGAIVGLFVLIVPELIENIQQFSGNAGFYMSNIQGFINRVMDTFGLKHVDMSKLIETVTNYFGTISQALDGMLEKIVEITMSVVSVITTGFISLALSIYILSGKEKLLMQVKRITKAYMPHKTHDKIASLYDIVVQVFEDYIAGQCKEAIILGSLCFIGMTILRLDYAGLISVIIGVTALVPILGAYIGGAIGAVLLLFISPGKALLFLVFLIILQQFEGNIIYPRVVGRKIGLPGMWVLLGISVGGGIMGIFGMIIAVPVTTILYQLLKKDVLRREGIPLKPATKIEQPEK